MRHVPSFQEAFLNSDVGDSGLTSGIKMLTWPVVGLETSVRGVGQDIVMRGGWAIGLMLVISGGKGDALSGFEDDDLHSAGVGDLLLSFLQYLLDLIFIFL